MKILVVHRLRKREINRIVDIECKKCPEKDICFAKTKKSRLKCVAIHTYDSLEYFRDNL